MGWERKCDKDKEENAPEQRVGPSEKKEVKCTFSSPQASPFPVLRSGLLCPHGSRTPKQTARDSPHLPAACSDEMPAGVSTG